MIRILKYYFLYHDILLYMKWWRILMRSMRTKNEEKTKRV
jgi:hypothetical protein